MREQVDFELLGGQRVVSYPHGREWEWSIGLPRGDEFRWCTSGGSVHLCVVRVDQRLKEGVPVALVLQDEVTQSGDYYTIISPRLALGLRVACERRDMLDVQAGHSVLEIARCELWAVVRQYAVG